jgi:parvulin-like peptidyl-prolyl isomerase
LARENTSRFKGLNGARPIQRFGLLVFGLLLAALFIVLAITEGLGDPSIPSGDVALVQSAPGESGHISKEAYKSSFERQATGLGLKKPPKEGTKKFEEVQSAALGELLTIVWIAGEAEELGISVTDKEIQAELASIKEQNFPTPKAFQEFLKTQHYTKAEVNELVELQILKTKIQELISKEGQPASSEEIDAYYEAEKATQFTTRASRDVRVVINKDKSKVEEARKLLEADQSAKAWKEASSKYSSDPTTKATGGLQKEITEEFVKGPVKAAIFENPIGKLSGPIKYQENFLLIEPIKANQERVKPLAEVRSQISQTLGQKKQQEHLTEWVRDFEEKWTLRTFCASGYVISKCANYPAEKLLEKSREAHKACYEANPKGGLPEEGCPASVEQTKPAMPGTVTTLKPGGEQLVQRPVPSASASKGAPTSVKVPAGSAAAGE